LTQVSEFSRPSASQSFGTKSFIQEGRGINWNQRAITYPQYRIDFPVSGTSAGSAVARVSLRICQSMRPVPSIVTGSGSVQT
jgi:hypothetical protein